MVKLNKNDVVLFQGDSITDGGRQKSMDGNHILGHGYQYIISGKLALDNPEAMPKFINKGVSGNSIAEVYARLYSDVIVHKPNIITFLAGTNDAGRNVGQRPEKTADRFAEIYKMMIEDVYDALPGTKVIVMEPFYLELYNFDDAFGKTPYALCEPYYQPAHIPENQEFMKSRRKAITLIQNNLKELKKELGFIYVPLQEAFFDMAAKTAPEYLLWDTVHPTVAGHELIARRWFEEVENKL